MNTPARLRGRRGGADVGAIRERLVRALRIGDRAGIRAELCLDVTLVVDSGGQGPVPPGVANGSDAVAGVLLGLVTPTTAVSTASINGAPGFVLSDDGRVVGAVSVNARSGLLSSLWVVCNPEKLRGWTR